ncbi:hypothetical protein [Cecembia sp.]|uniref:hypothetical protein n=1 Tax=Cecembia sp. TaxID=1898110 RepID=UPI0025BAF4D4|nr:hypothetical protein [Cecembia sp.]
MLALGTACDDFIPDPIEPRLPFFGGLGRNEAGAILNDHFFINNPTPGFLARGSQLPQYFRINSDSLSLDFELRTRDFIQYRNIQIQLHGLNPDDWTAMIQGFGKQFQIADPRISIKVFNRFDFQEENAFTGINSVPGQVTMKILPDERFVYGTFGFDVKNELGEKIQVRMGRFDYQFTDY